MIPGVYRDLLRDAQARRLLSGLGVSALGDGMSMVSVAWLAVLTAPAGNPGLFVGLAVAAYSLPGAAGAVALSRLLRHRPARVLVLASSWLRAGCLGAGQPDDADLAVLLPVRPGRGRTAGLCRS